MAMLERWLSVGAGLALAGFGAITACGGDDPAPITMGSGGDTGSSSSAQQSSSAVTTTTIASVTSSSTGMTFNCDPPAEQGSVYELSDIPALPPKTPVSMCEFRGDVILVYNAAAI
jgi:hypothetical protein